MCTFAGWCVPVFVGVLDGLIVCSVLFSVVGWYVAILCLDELVVAGLCLCVRVPIGVSVCLFVGVSVCARSSVWVYVGRSGQVSAARAKLREHVRGCVYMRALLYVVHLSGHEGVCVLMRAAK